MTEGEREGERGARQKFEVLVSRDRGTNVQIEFQRGEELRRPGAPEANEEPPLLRDRVRVAYAYLSICVCVCVCTAATVFTAFDPRFMTWPNCSRPPLRSSARARTSFEPQRPALDAIAPFTFRLSTMSRSLKRVSCRRSRRLREIRLESLKEGEVETPAVGNDDGDSTRRLSLSLSLTSRFAFDVKDNRRPRESSKSRRQINPPRD